MSISGVREARTKKWSGSMPSRAVIWAAVVNALEMPKYTY
jgi:hypothetical protein